MLELDSSSVTYVPVRLGAVACWICSVPRVLVSPVLVILACAGVAAPLATVRINPAVPDHSAYHALPQTVHKSWA